MNLDRYIGLKFIPKGRTIEGIDCWGLVRLFYKDEFGVELPSYSDEYESPTHRQSVSEAIKANLGNWTAVSSPNFGDVLVFRILGLPLHTGIYIGNGNFIHSYKNTNSCIERLKSVNWENRVLGIYRWSTI